MNRTTAIYRAKSLYNLVMKRGLYHDQHGSIEYINGIWVASIGDEWLVYLRDNGALNATERYPS